MQRCQDTVVSSYGLVCAMAAGTRPGGRRRDPDLHERILVATRGLLAERGYQGLSVDAVARAAGTTRPSVYLRFAGKEDLATSAVAGMTVDVPRPVTEDVHADLIAELRHFQASVTRPHGMSLVGTVLAEEHRTPRLIDRFRQRLVHPRRRRLGGALERGIRTGVLRPGLDIEAVTAMMAGGLYAHHLAVGHIPPDWPERILRSLWPAIRATETPHRPPDPAAAHRSFTPGQL